MRLRYYNNNIVGTVVYEMSHSLTSISRIEYGIFLFFADIGGLFGITYSLGNILTQLLTYNGP